MFTAAEARGEALQHTHGQLSVLMDAVEAEIRAASKEGRFQIIYHVKDTNQAQPLSRMFTEQGFDTTILLRSDHDGVSLAIRW